MKIFQQTRLTISAAVSAASAAPALPALVRMPAVPATDGQHLPGLAVDAGLKSWQAAAAYRKFLRKFARDYAASVQEIAQAEPNRSGLRRWRTS